MSAENNTKIINLGFLKVEITRVVGYENPETHEFSPEESTLAENEIDEPFFSHYNIPTKRINLKIVKNEAC